MKVILSRDATKWLRDCLSGPAWKKNDNAEKAARDSYKASQLLFDVIPEVEPFNADNLTDQLPEWELDEKNFLRIQRCLKFYLSGGFLPGTRGSFELQNFFKIGLDPVEGD